MSDTQGTDEVDTGKHGGARALAQAATRAQAEGDPTQAEALLDQAQRTDPDALADALSQADTTPALATDTQPGEDEEIAAISRTIATNADAPSRAGITGSGSGADGM